MLHPTERWISFHSMAIESDPDHAPQIHLKDLLGLFVAHVKAGDALKMLNDETASIRVADIQVKDSYVAMLIQYADKNATDPSFLDLNTQVLRKVSRLDGEGVAVSGHVMIGRTISYDGYYPLLIEQVPGITKSRILPFLRSSMKLVSKGTFLFKDELDNKKEKPYRPVVTLVDAPSKDFAEDLSDGQLDYIELVSRSVEGSGDFDEPLYFEETVRTIQLKVLRKTDPNIMGKAKRLMRRAKKEGYEQMKIRYTRPEGKRRTILMGTDISDLSNAQITKCEVINTEHKLEQCIDELDSVFVRKMAGLMG